MSIAGQLESKQVKVVRITAPEETAPIATQLEAEPRRRPCPHDWKCWFPTFSRCEWINRRRAAQGLPLIGLPAGDNPAISDDTGAPVEAAEDVKPAALAGGLVYDPTTATYRDDDHGG